jgi:hypothetical protein
MEINSPLSAPNEGSRWKEPNQNGSKNKKEGEKGEE